MLNKRTLFIFLFFTLTFFKPVMAAEEKISLSQTLEKIGQKLDTILKNQADMKLQIEDLKHEVYVTKIRASQA